MTDTTNDSPPTADHETPPPAASTSPVAHLGKPIKNTSRRFMLVYGVLGVVFIATIAGFVLLLVKPSDGSSATSTSGWSTWKPPHGTPAVMEHEIAQHVAQKYRLSKKGGQLVALVEGRPVAVVGTHKYSISTLAIKGLGSGSAINVVPSTTTWQYEFCGLGTECAISGGKATQDRGRLVRREALEVALDTFKFVPAINSVVAFMPPSAAGAAPSTLLYFQKADLAKELSEPLSKTLPLAKPPLPTQSDPQEARTIDNLTLPIVYKFSAQQLQDASFMLILKPLPLAG